MYCYWDFIGEQEGNGPTFEKYDKVNSILHPIGNMEKQCPFAILESSNEDFEELKQYSYIEEVPKQISSLLASSKTYPPALALTIEHIYDLDLNETITKEEFSKLVIALLHKYLERQHKDSFILSEFLSFNIHSGAYIGDFVWSIGYTPKIRLIHYVGFDYCIYADHVSCFKLTENQLKQLPIHEMKEYILTDHVNKKQAEFDLTDDNLDFDEISELIRTVRLQNVSEYLKKRK